MISVVQFKVNQCHYTCTRNNVNPRQIKGPPEPSTLQFSSFCRYHGKHKGREKDCNKNKGRAIKFWQNRNKLGISLLYLPTLFTSVSAPSIGVNMYFQLIHVMTTITQAQHAFKNCSRYICVSSISVGKVLVIVFLEL